MITQRETPAAVNTLSLGDSAETLVVGMAGGNIACFKISGYSKSKFVFEKTSEKQLLKKNISKVVRTTRNDFAVGTDSGIHFCSFNPKGSHNFVLSNEPVVLEGKDITELSEYALDQFVVGQWSENDFTTFDRQTQKSSIIKQPLWCNALCTDLVPLPGYHPTQFPFYLSKTMRSVNLLDFKQRKVHVLVETRDMPVDCFAYKKMCVTTTSDGRIKVIFVTSDKDIQNTIVDEIVLGRYFMKGLAVAMSGNNNERQPSFYSSMEKK